VNHGPAELSRQHPGALTETTHPPTNTSNRHFTRRNQAKQDQITTGTD
jgi:hypothetical protein